MLDRLPSAVRRLRLRAVALTLALWLTSAGAALADGEAEAEWSAQSIALGSRMIDPPLFAIDAGTLAIPTVRGIELFRRMGSGWERCGVAGTPPGSEDPNGLGQLDGPNGSVRLLPHALAITRDHLAIVNFRPKMGEKYQAREYLEVLARKGEGCEYTWDGRSVWTGPKGMALVHRTGLAADEDRIVLGDSRSGKVLVFQRSPLGWHEKAELAPEGRSGPLETSRDSRFGEGLALLRGDAGEVRIAVGEAHDDESLPASGTVYVYDDVGELRLRGKLYPTNSRPGDRFGFDLQWEGDHLRSYTRFFALGPDGNTVEEMAGSPLSPAALAKPRHITDVAWSGDLAVIGAPTAFNMHKGREYFEQHPGRIFVFERSGTEWREIAAPETPAGASDRYGAVVGVSGRQIFAADPKNQTLWVFERRGSEPRRLSTRPPSKEPQ